MTIAPEVEQRNELNTEKLFQIVKWAEKDQQMIADLRLFGTWDQQTWGSIQDIPEGLRGVIFAPEGNFEAAVEGLNACKTAFCMAGETVVSSDYRLLYTRTYGNDKYGAAEQCVKVAPTGRRDKAGRMLYEDVPGTVKDIDDAAQDILGIDEEETEHLFYGSNTLEYIKGRINGMCEARSLPILFPDHRPTDESFEEWENDEGDED